MVLGTIPLPVQQILVAPSLPAHIQDPVNGVGQMAINETWGRWWGCGRLKGAFGDWLEEGDVEHGMYIEGGREGGDAEQGGL